MIFFLFYNIWKERTKKKFLALFRPLLANIWQKFCRLFARPHIFFTGPFWVMRQKIRPVGNTDAEGVVNSPPLPTTNQGAPSLSGCAPSHHRQYSAALHWCSIWWWQGSGQEQLVAWDGYCFLILWALTCSLPDAAIILTPYWMLAFISSSKALSSGNLLPTIYI